MTRVMPGVVSFLSSIPALKMYRVRLNSQARQFRRHLSKQVTHLETSEFMMCKSLLTGGFQAACSPQPLRTLTLRDSGLQPRPQPLEAHRDTHAHVFSQSGSPSREQLAPKRDCVVRTALCQILELGARSLCTCACRETCRDVTRFLTTIGRMSLQCGATNLCTKRKRSRSP